MSTEAALRAPTERLERRRCLVTGASGYLGQRLVPLLCAAGAQVTAFVRRPGTASWPGLPTASANAPGIEVESGDLRDESCVTELRRRWRWDAVVHLAGSVPQGAGSFVEQAEGARAHVQIALGLASALPAGFAGRVVHASSMTVYGLPECLPIAESHATRPRFPYALGKLLAEDVWRSAAAEDCWILRLPGLFSAERRSGALYHFIRAALELRPIQISAPEPTPWDVLQVDDAALAILRVLGSSSRLKGPMNVSYGEPVELERMAALVSRETTGVAVTNVTGVVHPEFQLDITLARKLIEWPPCPFEQRLAQLIDALRSEGAAAR